MPTSLTSGTVTCTTNAAALFATANSPKATAITIYNRATSSGYVYVNVGGLHATGDSGTPIAPGTDKLFERTSTPIVSATVVADTNGAVIDWGVTKTL